jgi:hypothetical protein
VSTISAYQTLIHPVRRRALSATVLALAATGLALLAIALLSGGSSPSSVSSVHARPASELRQYFGNGTPRSVPAQSRPQSARPTVERQNFGGRRP